MLQGKDDSQPDNGANQQGTTIPEATSPQSTTQQAKISEDDFEDVTVEGLVLHSAERVLKASDVCNASNPAPQSPRTVIVRLWSVKLRERVCLASPL